MSCKCSKFCKASPHREWKPFVNRPTFAMKHDSKDNLASFRTVRCCALLIVGLVGCESMDVVSTDGPVVTPDHSLPKHEYPFDSSGRYREDWVKTPRGVEGGTSGRGSSSASKSRSSESSSRQTVASVGTRSGSRYHTVVRGDTLWGISRRYGVSVGALKSANKLSSDLVRTGQTLRIP